MQILLVEDNAFFRETFKQELSRHYPSAIITEAANGEEAMREIRMSPPQLIFMDCRLPGENGLQLTKKIKAKLPNVQIAMLTSYDFPEYRQTAYQNGVDRFFVKDSFFWGEVEEFIRCYSE